jgi:hypothetical protein
MPHEHYDREDRRRDHKTYSGNEKNQCPLYPSKRTLRARAWTRTPPHPIGVWA